MAYNNIVYVMYCTVTLHSKYFQSIQYIKCAPCIAIHSSWRQLLFARRCPDLHSAWYRAVPDVAHLDSALLFAHRCPDLHSAWFRAVLDIAQLDSALLFDSFLSRTPFSFTVIEGCPGHRWKWKFLHPLKKKALQFLVTD